MTRSLFFGLFRSGDRKTYRSKDGRHLAASVARQIMNTVGARLPETGGILLGPVGSEEVTGFHFDTGGSRSSVTYSPDHVTLRRLMRDEWLPSGIDMKGFAHSHPGVYDRLSGEDLRYIHRLLIANDDMRFFAAPLVIPKQFRMRPFVVMRDDTSRAVEADLILF